MSKKKVSLENHSYKLIPCINVEPNNSRYWFGRRCTNYEVRVVQETERVCCAICVGIMLAPGDPNHKISTVGYPKGWKNLDVFVDKETNVYYKGELQPEQRGKLPITEYETRIPIKRTTKRKKKTTKQDKEKKYLMVSKLKKQLDSEITEEEKQNILKQLKDIEKGL